MNVMRVWVVASVLVLTGALSGAPASAAAAAQAPPRASQAAKAPQPAVRVSMDQAVKMVEARFKARVVRADTQTLGGEVVYVMRLLDRHGRVFTVKVDASSGTIL